MNITLFDFNTCKHSILVIFVIGFVVGCVLEQAGGLHGVIRWFKFILRVSLVSCKCEWNFLIRCDEYYFIRFQYL